MGPCFQGLCGAVSQAQRLSRGPGPRNSDTVCTTLCSRSKTFQMVAVEQWTERGALRVHRGHPVGCLAPGFLLLPRAF